MAGELLQSLLKAQYKLNEDPYGISAGLIGAAAPSLINPYGSTGSNAAYTIGAGLLAGVLQGLGEKNVEEQNNALLAAATKALNSSGADRQRIFEENPRLNPFSAALTTDEIQRQRDALQKQAEADIEQKKYEKQKLYESNLARGIVDGQQLFDPAAEEARKTKLVEEAKNNVINQRKSGLAGLENIPQQLESEAIKEQSTKQNLAQSLDFIANKFEEAKKYVGYGSGIASSIGIPTDKDNALKGLADSVILQIDKTVGREMNSDVRDRVLSLAPKFYDSPETLEQKSKSLQQLVASLAPSTPILDKYLPAPIVQQQVVSTENPQAYLAQLKAQGVDKETARQLIQQKFGGQ